VIYLFRDDFFGEERLAELRASLGGPDVQSLNTSILDGNRITLSELRSTVEALPFLGEHRLVIVRRLFGGTSKSEGGRGDAPETGASRRGRADAEREKEFLGYLSRVPPSTILVVVEDPDFPRDHPAVRAVQAVGGEVHLDPMPQGEQLARWIGQRVRQKDGRIERAAADDLASAGVDDLRQLNGILDLLINYADPDAITSLHVRTLVPQSREATAFELVDAVGMRDRRTALLAYHRLLADAVSPIYLLTMLTRQIRLLLLAREALKNREDVALALKVHPRVADKLARQVRNFTVERCREAYRRLAAVDQAIKTGQANEVVAVELLLVELTAK
jgi:DNA polymerase III subunit delta